MLRPTERDPAIDAFSASVYGRTPPLPHAASATLLHEHSLGDAHRRQQWTLELTLTSGRHRSIVLVDLPVGRPVRGTFLGLNFRGNHACDPDPRIVDPSERNDVGDLHYEGLREPVELPIARGSLAHRWPTAAIVERGYAVVTACYLQLGPDSPQFLSEGILPLLHPESRPLGGRHDFGALAVWSWYLSRLLDLIRSGRIGALEAAPVTAVGHSRLGKAALWAAALDHRFAAVISNNSGCMGAALSRPVGETPEVLARIRPYWFTSRFEEEVLGGGRLPVDQHELLAAIAPRPLYVASASEDHNADPQGEFLSLLRASERWSPIGDPWTASFPDPGGSRWHEELPLGFHLRSGGHEMLPWDWDRWLDFTDRHVASGSEAGSTGKPR